MVKITLFAAAQIKHLAKIKDTLMMKFPALMEAAGATLVQAKDKAFAEQGLNGKPWKPLAESTLKTKRSQGKIQSIPPAPGEILILHDTGTLSGKYWNRQILPGPTLYYFTITPYAKFHQFGTKHIPARPFLPNQPVNYEKYLMSLVYMLNKRGIPTQAEYRGKIIDTKPSGGR